MDPPGQKFKREDTSDSEKVSEEESEEEMTDLDRWLVDPYYYQKEEEEAAASLMERLGNPEQIAEAKAWIQEKKEKQKIQEEKYFLLYVLL